MASGVQHANAEPVGDFPLPSTDDKIAAHAWNETDVLARQGLDLHSILVSHLQKFDFRT